MHQEYGRHAQENKEAATVGDSGKQDTGTNRRISPHALHGQWYKQSGKGTQQQIEQDGAGHDDAN